MLLGPHVQFFSLELPLDDLLYKRIKEQVTLPESLYAAHPNRQEKFLAGRYCVQQILKGMNEKDLQIPISADGSPLWPPGWIGSITHTEGFAMAALARTSVLRGLGIDTEPIMESRTYANVFKRILTPNELARGKSSDWDELEWGTLIFSAKESIYKCLRPLCGQFFGFEDAEIDEVKQDEGRFCFHLTRSIGGEFDTGWTGDGCFLQDKNFIHTAVELKT